MHKELIKVLKYLSERFHFRFTDRRTKNAIRLTFNITEGFETSMDVPYEKDAPKEIENFCNELSELASQTQDTTDGEVDQEKFEAYLTLVATLENLERKIRNRKLWLD